jgi:hypothetical protein
METMLCDLNKITIDDRIQSRAELGQNIVDEYANAITDGAKFPPGVVYFDGSTRWLASGFHRYFAYKLAGRAGMTVELRKGTLDDAILFSACDNQTHGLRRSNADKARSVMMLVQHQKFGQWSDREIAHKCGVSHTMVQNARHPERAEAKQEKAKKASGQKATARDKPQSGPGITITNPDAGEQVATVATKSQVIHKEDFGQEGDASAFLSAEVTRLNDRVAVLAAGNPSATPEEQQMQMEGFEALRRELLSVNAERDSIAAMRDAYMRENSELKAEVKRLRKKLDQALARA